MVGNFRTLHDLVIRQDDLAVSQIVAPSKVKHPLRSRTHNLHPLQFLARAHVLWFDTPYESVGIGNFAHDILTGDGNDGCLGRGALQLLQQSRVVAFKQNFLRLSE